jgi:hypothetical protein
MCMPFPVVLSARQVADRRTLESTYIQHFAAGLDGTFGEREKQTRSGNEGSTGGDGEDFSGDSLKKMMKTYNLKHIDKTNT